MTTEVKVAQGSARLELGWVFPRACRLALCFTQDWGLAAGDVLLLSACNAPASYATLLACRLAGLRLVLAPPSMSETALRELIANARPRALVAQGRSVRELARLLGVPHTMAVTFAASGELLAGEDAAEAVMERALPEHEGRLSFAELRSALHFSLKAQPLDAGIVLLSSGTTGVPKAMVCSHAAFEHNARELIRILGITSEDVLFAPVPFFHSYGVVTQYVALLSGAALVSVTRFKAEEALALMASEQVSVQFGVPTMFLRELTVQNSPDISSLRLGMIAGAACPDWVMREFEDRWNCTLVQSWGMTETAATLTVGRPSWPFPKRLACVGAPIEGVQLAISSTGEILVRSSSLMRGYLRDGALAAPPLDEGGWLPTGDLGCIRGNSLRITGRIKDLIIRGGENIMPGEVERIYEGHPDIAACCLVGFPDSELGERTCLCVIAAGTAPDPRKLREHAIGRIEKAKIPDLVLPMDDFPRLPNGKIDKRKLRSCVAREVVNNPQNACWRKVS